MRLLELLVYDASLTAFAAAYSKATRGNIDVTINVV